MTQQPATAGGIPSVGLDFTTTISTTSTASEVTSFHLLEDELLGKVALIIIYTFGAGMAFVCIACVAGWHRARRRNLVADDDSYESISIDEPVPFAPRAARIDRRRNAVTEVMYAPDLEETTFQTVGASSIPDLRATSSTDM